MAKTQLLTPEELGKFIRLDPISGDMFWKERTREYTLEKLGIRAANSVPQFNSDISGSPVNLNITSWGYYSFSLRGRQYSAHRAVYALHHGAWPKYQIDHVNGDRKDNRPENLRDVTRTENAQNQKKRTDNKSGYTGVRFEPVRNAWVAEIRVEGRYILLGRHKTRDIAYQIRKAASLAYGFSAEHGVRGGRSYKTEYTESQKNPQTNLA